jgi:hypothetical protein
VGAEIVESISEDRGDKDFTLRFYHIPGAIILLHVTVLKRSMLNPVLNEDETSQKQLSRELQVWGGDGA